MSELVNHRASRGKPKTRVASCIPALNCEHVEADAAKCVAPKGNRAALDMRQIRAPDAEHVEELPGLKRFTHWADVKCKTDALTVNLTHAAGSCS